MAKNLAPKSYYTLQEVAAYWSDKYDMQLSADDLVHYGARGSLSLYVLSQLWQLSFSYVDIDQKGKGFVVPFAELVVDGPLALRPPTLYQIEKSGFDKTNQIEPIGPVIEEQSKKNKRLAAILEMGLDTWIVNIKARMDVYDYMPPEGGQLESDEIYVTKDDLYLLHRDVQEFEATHFDGLPSTGGTAANQPALPRLERNTFRRHIEAMAEALKTQDEQTFQELDFASTLNWCHRIEQERVNPTRDDLLYEFRRVIEALGFDAQAYTKRGLQKAIREKVGVKIPSGGQAFDKKLKAAFPELIDSIPS